MKALLFLVLASCAVQDLQKVGCIAKCILERMEMPRLECVEALKGMVDDLSEKGSANIPAVMDACNISEEELQ